MRRTPIPEVAGSRRGPSRKITSTRKRETSFAIFFLHLVVGKWMTLGLNIFAIWCKIFLACSRWTVSTISEIINLFSCIFLSSGGRTTNQGSHLLGLVLFVFLQGLTLSLHCVNLLSQSYITACVFAALLTSFSTFSTLKWSSQGHKYISPRPL